MTDKHEQVRRRGIQAEGWVSAGEQPPQTLLWKRHCCLLRFWALVSVPQMDLSARLLSKRAAWVDTPERNIMRKASSSQGPHSVKGSCLCGRREPRTCSSLSHPFTDRGCARPCCGSASSSCLLRSTPLETIHRIFRNRVGTFGFPSATCHLGSPLRF